MISANECIIIDCDADPYVPNGVKIEEHKKGGQLVWNREKVKLYLSEDQQNLNYIEGNKLRKELAKMPVLNANVLDYLLKNPDLIPTGWKGKSVYFWGTIYRGSGGGLSVRCMCWGGRKWRWRYDYLIVGWSRGRPAALLATEEAA